MATIGKAYIVTYLQPNHYTASSCAISDDSSSEQSPDYPHRSKDLYNMFFMNITIEK